jgi:hypothetical protein
MNTRPPNACIRMQLLLLRLLAGAARVRESQGSRAAVVRVSFVQTVKRRELFQIFRVRFAVTNSSQVGDNRE